MELENANKQKAFIKNVAFVTVSNVLTLFVGILSGFLIPKILSINDYGYYKTFALYTTYVGVFHFGFIDGVLLKFAGKSKEEIDLHHFRTIFRFLVVFELLVTICGICVAFFFLNSQIKWIFVFIAINLFSVNITSFYEYIVQITMDFKRLSIRSVIRTSIQFIALAILVAVYFVTGINVNPFIYIGLLVFINYFLLLWYLISYKDFLFGKAVSFKISSVFPYFKRGFPLMVCNLVVMLICAIDQIFVNVLFDNETYAYYAFAYSMVGVLMTMTSAISIVLFPTLKSFKGDTIKKYAAFNSYLLIFAGASLASYQVFRFVVLHFLQKYTISLDVLRVVIPIVLITSSITVVKYNFYKKDNMILPCFIETLIVLLLSIGADAVVYLLFRNTLSISIISIIVCCLWYLIVEIYFCQKNKLGWFKNFAYLVLLLIGYYSLMLIDYLYFTFVIYLVFFFSLTGIFYKDIINERVRLFKNRQTV